MLNLGVYMCAVFFSLTSKVFVGLREQTAEGRQPARHGAIQLSPLCFFGRFPCGHPAQEILFFAVNDCQSLLLATVVSMREAKRDTLRVWVGISCVVAPHTPLQCWGDPCTQRPTVLFFHLVASVCRPLWAGYIPLQQD